MRYFQIVKYNKDISSKILVQKFDLVSKIFFYLLQTFVCSGQDQMFQPLAILQKDHFKAWD